MKGVRETADALSDSSAEKTAKLHSSFRIVVCREKEPNIKFVKAIFV